MQLRNQSASIGDLTAVSLSEFETKTSDETANYGNYGTKCDISGMTLDLSLGQKTENPFAADQTPTPTRLIKNCDEVGLFEDLQHVNPFDIGFQRAAEQNAVGVTPQGSEALPCDGDSLHTPQVYPLDATTTTAPQVNTSSSPLDVAVPNVEDLLKTPPTAVTVPVPPPPPAPQVQVIQPQLITWVLPAQALPVASSPVPARSRKPSLPVRPLILPKPSTTSNYKGSTTPSSASLTPTSQLPIKERLKAILHSIHNNNTSNKDNNNRRQRSFATSSTKPKSTVRRNEDCMERRRAAASRYRHKMRNEHLDIKEQNAQLQQENRDLRERIAALERQLQQQQLYAYNNNAQVVGNQIQIPPASIHLVINVPKVTVPSSEPTLRPDQKEHN